MVTPELLAAFVRDLYETSDPIPLHAPVFQGREREYVLQTIDSTFVSSVGAYVDQFEASLAAFTGAPRAVAIVNGTAALHVSLMLAGVQPSDLVITQPLTFVATCNAISYCGAHPLFIDVDRSRMSLCPVALQSWLQENAEVVGDVCRVRADGRVIRACVPMHTFGHPAALDELVAVCRRWSLTLIEDAAESLGSLYKGRHTGTIGDIGVLSFNGNKIITTGGGGAVLSDRERGATAKHLTTTAKKPHPWAFEHDRVGYNYRLPNINAALGCAQMERLAEFVTLKRRVARRYESFLAEGAYRFVGEPADSQSNYWLNAVLCEDAAARDDLLARTNALGVMTRPIWALMNRLPMYRDALSGPLPNAQWLEDRVVNLPSSVAPAWLST